MVSLHCFGVSVGRFACVYIWQCLLYVYFYFSIFFALLCFTALALVYIHRDSLRGNFVKPHAIYRVVSKYFASLLMIPSLSFVLIILFIVAKTKLWHVWCCNFTFRYRKICASFTNTSCCFFLLAFILNEKSTKKRSNTQLKFVCKWCT